MKIQCQHFYQGIKNLVVPIGKGNVFQQKVIKVTDVNAPKEILKNYWCCYLCLKTEHLSKKCTKNYISQI